MQVRELHGSFGAIYAGARVAQVIRCKLHHALLCCGSKSHNTFNTKFSLTYKSLQFKPPSSILDLLKIQPTHSTRSSAVVTLQRPFNSPRLKITDRSFYHQAPALWNSLPQHLRAFSSNMHLLKSSTLSTHCLLLNSTNN